MTDRDDAEPRYRCPEFLCFWTIPAGTDHAVGIRIKLHQIEAHTDKYGRPIL